VEFRDFKPLSPFRWLLPKEKVRGMTADAEIIASEPILRAAADDASLTQVINVASLPRLVGRSLAMPDIHYGYGFCIGGVAAFREEDGIVLPGGVGYDINCGVRLLSTAIPADQARADLESLGAAILRHIPTGLTKKTNYPLDQKQFQEVVRHGAREIVRRFAGREEDLAFIESGGRLAVDRLEIVSRKAFERGDSQLGSLGSGNHFIEVQEVEEIFDPEAAQIFGLQRGMLTLMIHTGSRGFGHQIATDFIETFRRKNISRLSLPDPQLIYADIHSSEGQNYLQALNAASNFAWANRHLLMEDLIAIFERTLRQPRERLGMRLVYDQAHNIAKFETHTVGGREMKLLVHRKGATRAFPAGNPDIPAAYRAVGQPVIIPGSMGTPSFVLRGTPAAMELTFGSSAHGAGRRLSRHQAIKVASQFNVRERLKERQVLVFSFSSQGLKEEIPEAYKEIAEVVDATTGAGISSKVARLRPLVVVKG